MKIIVIYKSKTGFTEQYAKWLSQSLDCEAVSYKNRMKIDLPAYDTIIYGAGFYAGSIGGIKWLKKQLPELTDKKKIVFVTGASPMESPDTRKAIEGNFTKEELEGINAFYCRGGLSYGKLGPMDKILMKMMSSFMERKKDKTAIEEAMAEVIKTSFNAADRKLLEPIIDCAKKA